MPAPAAPRKKGALTSSTAPKTAENNAAVPTARSVAATRRTASNSEADLVNRLEQVSLSNTAATRRTTAASTSRLQRRTAAPVKASSSASSSAAAAAQPPASSSASAETLLSSVNNTLSKLSVARKAASQPLNTCSTFVNAVKTANKELDPALKRLRKLASSSQGLADQSPPQKTRLLSVERAAILLVSHCVDANLYDSAIAQLISIRQSLISIYNSPNTTVDEPGNDLVSQLENLKIETSNGNGRTSSRATSATSAPSKHGPSAATSRISSAAANSLEKTASLLSFPTFPQDWSSSYPIQDVCTSILIAQNQILSCFFGMPSPAPSASSRTTTPASSISRRTPAASTSSLDTSESRCEIILSALQAPGSPLAVFRDAARLLAPEDKVKSEHYISTIYSLIMKRTSEIVINTDISPNVTLGLHMYGLECLMENRSYFALRPEEEDSLKSEDKAVNSLASSLHRAIVSFGKLSTANAVSEAAIAEHLSRKVLPLLEQIKDVVKPHERLHECKPFLETTSLLTQLFERGNIDTQLLRMETTQASDAPTACEPDSPEEPLTSQQSPVDLERQGIKACTNLATQVTMLEKWIASQYTLEEFDSDAVRASLEQAAHILLVLPPGGDEADTNKTNKIRHNLNRSMERLHHYAYRAYKLLQKEPSTSPDRTTQLSTLRSVLAAFCEAAIVPEASPDLQGRAIDTLLLFAHADFAVDAPTTYRNSFGHIERCQRFLNNKASTTLDHRLHGTIASSAYAIGRTLYNAEKYANCIPFLTASCKMTDALLNVSDTPDLGDAHISLLDKSASRWELLGSACIQCKEKEDAVHAYMQCLRSLHLQSAAGSATPLLHDAPFLRVLAKYTKVTVLDMSWPSDKASIAASLEKTCTTQLDALTTGLILEAQYSCLAEYTHKPEAFQASHEWLADAAQAFKTCRSDANLARVQYHRMCLAFHQSASSSSEQLAELASEIEQLCSHVPATRAAQYTGFAKLLCAIDMIRQHNPKASKNLAKQAKDALTVLRSAFFPASADINSVETTGAQTIPPLKQGACSGTPKKPVAVHQARTNARPLQANRKPLSPRSANTASSNRIVTPPRKTNRKLDEHSTPDRKSAKSTCKLENAQESLALLVTVAAMLGLYEHTFLRLGYLRLIKHLYAGYSADGFIRSCLELAGEYQSLGQWKRAQDILRQAQDTAVRADLSVETRVLLFLREAEILSSRGESAQGYEAYQRALRIAESLTSQDGPSSSRERISSRCNLLYNTARGAEAFAVVAEHKGNPFEALSSSLQALRLCNRALSNLARLGPNSLSAAAETASVDSAVTGGGPKDSLMVSDKGKAGEPVWADPLAPLGWMINQSLARLLIRIAGLYQTRGSVKLACYFYQQAVDMSDTVASPRLKAKVLAKQIELLHATNRELDFHASLDQLKNIASTEGGLSSIEILDFSAQIAAETVDSEAAAKASSTALTSLTKLNKAFVDSEAQFTSPPHAVSKSSEKHARMSDPKHLTRETILPELHSRVIRNYISSMLGEVGQQDKVEALLAQLHVVLSGTRQGPEESILDARIRLQRVFSDLQQDPVAGLLCESVLSVPPLIRLGGESNIFVKPEFPSSLLEVELSLLGSVASHQVHASPPRWKDITGALSHLRVLRANMGQSDALSAEGIICALEAGTAVAARREMLEVLHTKLTQGILRDDLVWPAAQPRLTVSKPLSAYWQATEARYSRSTTKGNLPASTIASVLPHDWSVLSLHMALDGQSLLATRYDKGQRPVVLQLPLDRVHRREGEEELFGLALARSEMSDIIQSANATSQNAKNMVSMDERRKWWTERKELDQRLARLVVDIEQRWLGVYKHILTKPSIVREDQAVYSRRHSQLWAIIEKILSNTRTYKAGDSQMDAILVDAFYSLPSDASDEDIEDWLHFVIDSLQFAGAHVACDEIDLDHAIVDLRNILEERPPDSPLAASASDTPEAHLFLVLDKGLHLFPWESLPCLQGKSTSRLPSLDFLKDRLDLLSQQDQATAGHLGVVIDPAKVFYVLNPGGDLKHTQKEFAGILSAKHWQGITERVPMEEEMRRGLSSAHAFLYFGHGGAEQYMRVHVLQGLIACATSFLWGCSSGYLKDQGGFEETGTPIAYMQAGAPAVVGNLWDVTDKDLDRYTHSALEAFGLFGNADTKVSLPRAIASARSACTLRYLNGAAPVVWGIPVSIL